MTKHKIERTAPKECRVPENIPESPRFSCIYADCPWAVHQTGRYGAINHYDLMSLDRIKAMPVSELAAENAHLWLWIPNGLLQEGLDVIKAWGFEYKNSFYWVKSRLQLGVYLRNASETCLFAVRGKAPARIHNQPNWLFAPNQSHSKKPDEMYEIINRFSPGPYLELFARKRPHNPEWKIWGNEAEGGSDIFIPGYPVPEYSFEKKDVKNKEEA